MPHEHRRIEPEVAYHVSRLGDVVGERVRLGAGAVAVTAMVECHHVEVVAHRLGERSPERGGVLQAVQQQHGWRVRVPPVEVV